MLEHEPDLALAHVPVGGVVPIEQHAALIGVFQAGDDPEQGSLAAAGGAQQCNQLACREIERDAVERSEPTEGLTDVLDSDAHGTSPVDTVCDAFHST